MSKKYCRNLFLIILLSHSFLINAQNFVQNDAERNHVHQILNTYSNSEIPEVKKIELNAFFVEKNVSKPEATKYIYLLNPLFNKDVSTEDWNFYFTYLKNNFSDNERFPSSFLLKLKK